MKIKIRKATDKDLQDIFRVEKASYTPMLQATQEVIVYRMRTFGIWVAEVDGRVRGFFTCVPVWLNWPSPNIKKFLANRKPRYLPWYKEYEKGGKFNTLLISSTAVESDYQGMGIGTELVKFSLKLSKKLGLEYRASALRCEYGKFFKKTRLPISDYVSEVERGRIKDCFLSLYLKLGFKLGPVLPDYEPFKGSLNNNIFAYFDLN